MDEAILIAGAGPSGLTAAVECARRGLPVHIVEQRAQRAWHSKALGVNPRSLELLEPSGVVPRLIEAGRLVNRIEVWDDQRRLVALDLTELDHPYPHMLVLPQSETEAILEEHLAGLGVTVERSTTLADFEQFDAGLDARLTSPRGERQTRASWLIAADGARSGIRQRLGVDFPGSQMPATWELLDVRMTAPWDPDPVMIRLATEGPMLFALRMRDDLYRLASNAPGLIERLPPEATIHEVVWQSEFHVSHRQAERLHVDRVCLIGDAAHIHSPLGARGMNLGIEDACLLAAALTHGGVAAWADQRHRRTAKVVRLVRNQTRMATSTAWWMRLLRRQAVPTLLAWPRARRAVLRRLAGLA